MKLAALCLLLVACSKTTPSLGPPSSSSAQPEPAPTADASAPPSDAAEPPGTPVPTPALPPIGPYAKPEEALVAYLEGKRTSDAARLLSVMPVAARAVMEQALAKAKSGTTDEQLAHLGITRDQLAALTPVQFFAIVVKAQPSKETEHLGDPVTDIIATPDSPTTMRLAFKLGGSACQGYCSRDPEGWKVQFAHCDKR